MMKLMLQVVMIIVHLLLSSGTLPSAYVYLKSIFHILYPTYLCVYGMLTGS